MCGGGLEQAKQQKTNRRLKKIAEALKLFAEQIFQREMCFYKRLLTSGD